MEVHEYFRSIFTAKPVSLCAAGQCDRRWCKFVGRAVLVVDGRACRAGCVAILGEVEVAEVCAEGGEGDVFEVVVCAVGTFEGGDEGTACCGGD